MKSLQHCFFYPGPCANLVIDTLTENDGGRKMIFKWYVREKAGVSNATATDMEALNSTLSALPSFSPFFTIGSDRIVKDVEYKIVVEASNFLGESTEATLAITRKAEAVPEVELSSTGENIQRSQRVLLRGKFTLLFYDLFDWVIREPFSVLTSKGNLFTTINIKQTTIGHTMVKENG